MRGSTGLKQVGCSGYRDSTFLHVDSVSPDSSHLAELTDCCQFGDGGKRDQRDCGRRWFRVSDWMNCQFWAIRLGEKVRVWTNPDLHWLLDLSSGETAHAFGFVRSNQRLDEAHASGRHKTESIRRVRCLNLEGRQPVQFRVTSSEAR